MVTSDKPLLHGRQIAALRMGISLRALDTLLANGELVSVKIGKRRLVSEQAIQTFIKKSERAKRR